MIRPRSYRRGKGRIDNESRVHPPSALVVSTKMSCLKKLCGRKRQHVNQDYPVQYSERYVEVYTAERVRVALRGERIRLLFSFSFFPAV